MYAELELKKCLSCKEEKSLDEFRFRTDKPKRKPHYECYCKKCERTKNKAWYYEQGGKQIQKSKDFIRNCKKFGITSEQYEQMAIKQSFKCSICKQPETAQRCGVIKNLAIDHCHTTGKVRELLCHNCNTAIGSLKESVSITEAALQYLKKFKK